MEDVKPTNNKTCSCWQKSDCLLNQNCLCECLVYNAVVNRSTTKNYYGTCEKSFKERYNNHTSSFRYESRQKSTELWWESLSRLVNCYQSTSIHLLNEKIWFMFVWNIKIARANSASLLNKPGELVSKCRHMNKFTLKCFKNR